MNEYMVHIPEHLGLQSSGSTRLVVRDGKLVLGNDPTYPAFYVDGEHLNDWLESQGQARINYSVDKKLPAMVGQDGLVMDRRWECFGAFIDPKDERVPWNIQQQLRKGEIAWDLQCPVMQGPASLIGQLIRVYGLSTGANPDRPGMNPNQGMLEFPLTSILRKASAQQLRAFRDRDRTLLDLACEHQQWALAQFVWDKGVRWSEDDLVLGTPLAALTLTSQALQGPGHSQPIDAAENLQNVETRAAWLQQWLRRYRRAGGVIDTDEPVIDWRGRLGQARGLDDHAAITDTPASFWITRFMPIKSGLIRLTKPEQLPEHALAIIQTWAGFWDDAGVDLDQVACDTGARGGMRQGMADFWSIADNGRLWADYLRTWMQQRRLERDTPAITRVPRSPGRL